MYCAMVDVVLCYEQWSLMLFDYLTRSLYLVFLVLFLVHFVNFYFWLCVVDFGMPNTALSYSIVSWSSVRIKDEAKCMTSDCRWWCRSVVGETMPCTERSTRGDKQDATSATSAERGVSSGSERDLSLSAGDGHGDGGWCVAVASAVRQSTTAA